MSHEENGKTVVRTFTEDDFQKAAACPKIRGHCNDPTCLNEACPLNWYWSQRRKVKKR